MFDNYQEVNEKLGKRDSRKLARNTYLKRRSNTAIAVLYHETDVVTFKDNGDVMLNSGGWKTMSTKDRINSFSPVRITCYKGTWYVYNPKDRKNSDSVVNNVVFKDGMIFKANGKFENAEKPNKNFEKQNNQLKRKVTNYVKNYMQALEAGKVSAPSSGDCWYCSMRVGAGETKTGVLHSDESSSPRAKALYSNQTLQVVNNQASVGLAFTGKTWGEQNGDCSHIKDHMKEKYYVPSLLVRAIEVFPVSIAAKDWYLASFWDDTATQEQKDTARRAGRMVGQEQIKRSLRRYIYRQLGFQA